MKTQRGFVFRLDPTADQARTFSRWAGVCRAVYNAALFQRETFGRKGRSFGFAQQCRELTALRAEFDWIREVSQTAEQQALKDLQQAFENFYEGRADYPTPRRKHVNESFRLNWRECSWRRLNRNWACVRLPKIGDIRFRLTRAIPADIRNITISHTPLGWHIAFCCAIDLEESEPVAVAAGIDRGVANSIALSNGETPVFPRDDIRALELKQGRWQRVAARRKRGSKRYARARRRAAALKAKAARARKHWNHVQTSRIAAACEIVVLEDLKIGNMTASAKGTAEEPGR
jgi:putative transposase